MPYIDSMLMFLAAAAIPPANDLPVPPTPSIEAVAAPAATALPTGNSAEWRRRMTDWSPPELLPDTPFPALVMKKPVATGFLSSTFGVRSDPLAGGWRAHRGIDIAAPLGTPVTASADGVVSFAGNAGGYGLLVQIDRTDGIQIRYGHLSAIVARRGESVRRGDAVGAVGSTGRSTGSHLHFEIRVQGVAVDPLGPLPISTSSLSTGLEYGDAASVIPRPGPTASDERLPAAYP